MILLSGNKGQPAWGTTFSEVNIMQHAWVRFEKMVPRGLEPRTLRLLAVRSNQLSYETCALMKDWQLRKQSSTPAGAD